MCKFMVVLCRRPDFSRQQFLDYLRDVHGPLAESIPGVLKYVQNHVVDDRTRQDPGWDAIVELRWQDRATMETAWLTPQGQAATNDLPLFADLTRTRWSIVEEHVRR